MDETSKTFSDFCRTWGCYRREFFIPLWLGDLAGKFMIYKGAGKLDEMTIAVVSAIPLFYAASGVEPAILLGGSVLLSLLAFETVFFFVKQFWLHSLRPLLALIVSASVLTAIYLVFESLLGWSTDRTAQIFPLTLVSAFLLSQSALAVGESFGVRLRTLSGFFGLLLLIGICRQWTGTFQMFLPGSFWVSGVALATFFLLKRKLRF